LVFRPAAVTNGSFSLKETGVTLMFLIVSISLLKIAQNR
jgi:hypothetical protein